MALSRHLTSFQSPAGIGLKKSSTKIFKYSKIHFSFLQKPLLSGSLIFRLIFVFLRPKPHPESSKCFTGLFLVATDIRDLHHNFLFVVPGLFMERGVGFFRYEKFNTISRSSLNHGLPHSGYITVVEPYQISCYGSNFSKLLLAVWFEIPPGLYHFHFSKKWLEWKFNATLILKKPFISPKFCGWNFSNTIVETLDSWRDMAPLL